MALRGDHRIRWFDVSRFSMDEIIKKMIKQLG
jgi:hypothetical protein